MPIEIFLQLFLLKDFLVWFLFETWIVDLDVKKNDKLQFYEGLGYIVKQNLKST